MVTFRGISNPLQSQQVEGNSLKEKLFDAFYQIYVSLFLTAHHI